MKTRVLLLCVACAVMLAGCVSPIARNGGIVVRGEPREAPDFLSYYSDETIVYVTKSGEKYHTADCTYLTDSAIPVSLEQALTEGRTPCSHCHPPQEAID